MGDACVSLTYHQSQEAAEEEEGDKDTVGAPPSPLGCCAHAWIVGHRYLTSTPLQTIPLFHTPAENIFRTLQLTYQLIMLLKLPGPGLRRQEEEAEEEEESVDPRNSGEAAT